MSPCLRYAPLAAARRLFALLTYAIRGAYVPASPVLKWQPCRSGMTAISSGLRETCPGGEVASPRDIVAVISVARCGRRQQHYPPGGRYSFRIRDHVFHRPRQMHPARGTSTQLRCCLRLVINSPAAVAEADDGVRYARRKRLEELAVVDPAIIAAHDQSDVSTGINRQRRQRRFGYRRNTVVDKKDIAVLTELLLSVRQAPEVAGRVERHPEVEIEHFCNRECAAQIGSVVRSDEMSIAHNSDPLPTIKYLAVVGVNSALVVEQGIPAGGPRYDRGDRVSSGAIDDTALTAAQ